MFSVVFVQIINSLVPGWFWDAHAVGSKYFAVMISATFKFKMIFLEDDAGFYLQYVLNFHKFYSDLTPFKDFPAKVVIIYRTFPVFFNMVEGHESWEPHGTLKHVLYWSTVLMRETEARRT